MKKNWAIAFQKTQAIEEGAINAGDGAYSFVCARLQRLHSCRSPPVRSSLVAWLSDKFQLVAAVNARQEQEMKGVYQRPI